MANVGTTNGAVILTIPAFTTWQGYVQLSASIVVGPNGAAASANPSVTLSGSGGNWISGDTVASVNVAAPAALLTALTGTQGSNSTRTPLLQIRANANPVTLTLNVSGAGVTAVAVAGGEML